MQLLPPVRRITQTDRGSAWGPELACLGGHHGRGAAHNPHPSLADDRREGAILQETERDLVLSTLKVATSWSRWRAAASGHTDLGFFYDGVRTASRCP